MDPARKKWLLLTPEEWVRQHFLQYLFKEKGFPVGLTGTECTIKVGKLTKRCDLVVYNQQLKPMLIVECKAPEVNVDEKAFTQIAIYNMGLMVEHLIVTNGMQHYYCSIDHVNRSFQFHPEIPDYQTLKKTV